MATTLTAPALAEACSDVKNQLLKICIGNCGRNSPVRSNILPNFYFAMGRIAHRTSPDRSIGYGDLLSLSNLQSSELSRSRRDRYYRCRRSYRQRGVSRYRKARARPAYHA